MTTTYTQPLLGIQFDHPKNLRVYLHDAMQQQGVVQIHFFDKTSPTKQFPFFVQYLVNKGTNLDQTATIIVNRAKKLNSMIPSIVPPTVNTNFMNSTKHKQIFNTRVFELEMLPMKVKQWNYLVDGPSTFIHGEFTHTPNSTEEFTMFQKIMESFEFIQPLSYGTLSVNDPISGLNIPVSVYMAVTDDPNDPNMIFDAKGGREEMFCYKFTGFKSLDEFVETRKNRWSQIEKFNIETLHVDVEATILEFMDPNSGYYFTEMCFENNGNFFLINGSKTKDSNENFMVQLMGTTFLQPNKNKKKSLVYNNHHLLPFEVQFPLDGNVLEEIGADGIVSYVDSQNLTFTKVSILDSEPNSNHNHLLNTLTTGVTTTGGKITSCDVRNIKDKEYGSYTLVTVHFLSINNGYSAISSGLLYNGQNIVIDSLIHPQHVPRFIGIIQDIHQSVKPGTMGIHDFNFKSNLLNDQAFGDIFFTGVSNDFETFCFHVGVKFVHSSQWDIQVNRYYPPPSVQYNLSLKNKKDAGTLTVDVLPSKQTLETAVETFVHGKEVLERTKFKIHKFDAELVLTNTKFGKEWNVLCVRDQFIYAFVCTEETVTKDFIKLVKKCKFIEPMNNGRSMYHNAEFQLSFLMPSFDFTPSMVNTRDTLVFASAQGISDFSIALMKNEDSKDMNSLIELRKNINSQSFRSFKDRKPFREDILDGHIFEMKTSGELKDVSILEYSFMRNGVGLSLIYRGWTEQFEIESPELYLLEMKFDPSIKKDAICYECILYNFSISIPPKTIITEFLHADSQIHASEVVSFVLPDQSLTYITKEPYQFRGVEHFYEETKMRILSAGNSILSIRLDKRKNCNVFVTTVYDTKKTGFIGVMSKFKFSEGSALSMDTNIEKSKFKDSYLDDWIEMHQTFQTLMQPSFFDPGVLEYSLKIDLPTEFVDTEFIFQ
jgi:hypothetical protein